VAGQEDRVTKACLVFHTTKKACNVFTREVAIKVGVDLPVAPGAVADEILDAMRLHWRRLSRQEAILAAANGRFIVAGLKSGDFKPRKDGKKTADGHVCVVVSGSQGGYPRVFSTNQDDNPSAYGKSCGDHPLNGFVFSHGDAPNVEYFSKPAGASGNW